MVDLTEYWGASRYFKKCRRNDNSASTKLHHWNKLFYQIINKIIIREKYRDHRGRDRMVDLQLHMYSVLIATKDVEFRFPLMMSCTDTTLCDKVCQWLAVGWWYSQRTPVSSANKTEIFLKVTFNIIPLTLTKVIYNWSN